MDGGLSVELVNAVQQSLLREGVLDALRSQLRAHVLTALKKSGNPSLIGHSLAPTSLSSETSTLFFKSCTTS